MPLPGGRYAYTEDGENIRYFDSFMEMVDATPSGAEVNVFPSLDFDPFPSSATRSHPRSSGCSCEGCKYSQKTIDRVKRWRDRRSFDNFLFVIDEGNVLVSALIYYMRSYQMFRGRDTTNRRAFITFESASSAYENEDFIKFMSLLIQDAIKYNILALNSQGELIIPVREFNYAHTWTYEMLGFFICHALRNNITLGFPISRPLVEAIQSGRPAAIYYEHFRAFDSELFDNMEKIMEMSENQRQYYTVEDKYGNELPVTEGLLPLLMKKQVMDSRILPTQLPLIYLSLGFCRAASATVFRDYPVDMFIKDLKGTPAGVLDVERLMKNVHFNGPSQQASWFREAFTSLTSDQQMSILQYITDKKSLTTLSAVNLDRPIVVDIDRFTFSQDDLELPCVSKCMQALLLPLYSSLEVTKRNLAAFVENIRLEQAAN